MGVDRKAQATALRKFADYIEEGAGDLPDEVEDAVQSITDLIWAEAAAHDWHEREAKGEKTIPAAEVRRLLRERRQGT